MPRARDLNRHVASETAYDFQDLRCFFVYHVLKGPPLVTSAYHGHWKKTKHIKNTRHLDFFPHTSSPTRITLLPINLDVN
jgi:hypothetical protein